MTANVNPIFSRSGAIGAGPVLTTAAADYTGQGASNAIVFTADPTNGSFVQRLRFKALGTNVASVARVFINNGGRNTATNLSAVSGTPTGTPSTTGGVLPTGSYFAKIYAVDQYGGVTAASTETASVSVTGPTGSVAWAWTAVTGAVKYLIVVGTATGVEQVLFTSTTNSFTQIAVGTFGSYNLSLTNNNTFFDELALPATTAVANAATQTMDLPMGIALPPGFTIVVGLGTTVSAGWAVTTIAGNY